MYVPFFKRVNMFKKLAIIIGLGFYFTGCMTANSIRQTVQPQNIETVSELEWADPYPRPEWVSNGGVDTEEHLFFVGMSTKRQDERDASREASNDALLKYTEYCGVDIQYVQEHTDSEIGSGGAIKTSTLGKQGSIARIDAHVSRSKVISSYKEKYRNFHGGMFLSHSFKTAVLLRVPKEVVANCKNTSVIAQSVPKTNVIIEPKQQLPVIVNNKQFTFDEVTLQSFATWDRTEDLFIRLKNVNFGVRHYKDFAFKLQRGYGYDPISEERIRIGNFRGYCYYEQLYQCWEKFNYSDKDLAFTKASFTNMSENDKKILEVLAKNLPDIISKAVKKIAQSRAIGPPKTVTKNYKLTEHEQNLWIEQAKRMSINFS